MNKVEGKASDWCPKCKNCKDITRESNGVHVWLTEVDCEDPYDGMIKTLDADSDICCSMFELKKEKEPFHLNMPSRIISEEEYNNLKKDHDSWRDLYYELRYALRKDETLDESISCVRDVPSDVEMIEDLKKRAADSDYYKKKSELLEVKLKNANGVAESWKRDYEFVRDKFVHPVYDILYPDNLNRDINVADFLSNIKDLKIYADENKSMYEDLKYWRERCHKAETDVTTLNSKIETLKNKNTKLNQTISDQEVTIKALLITIKEMCKEENENG